MRSIADLIPSAGVLVVNRLEVPMFVRRRHALRSRSFANHCVLVGMLLVTAAALSCPAAAMAANPSFGGISPVGAQRGAEVDIVLGGGSLADAQSLYFYEPGIEVKSWEVVDDKQVKVKLAIAADCRLGAHPLRIRSATGISNLRTFSVGALKEAVETEPNSDFAQPQAAELDTTINGVIQAEDVDYFVVQAAKGQRITAEVEGIRLGNTFFDPYVAIMDAKRFELANSDDAALVWQDGVASVVAPEDGAYIIQIRESAFGGSGACSYRLHVGTFPRPTAVIPAGGRPGTTLQVRWLGDVGGEWTEEVPLPAELRPNFGVHAHDAHGISPSANVFRLGDLDNVLEVEPNNAPAEATPFAAPMALEGIIAAAADVDCFKFTATQGQVFDVNVHARSLRSPLDSVLNILKGTGEGVAGNDDNGTPDSYLRFTAPADGEYVIQIRDHLGKGGPDYTYRCELAPVQPRLSMSLPEKQQYVDVTLSVPKGNRGALLVGGNRADFGGELAVEIKDLPPGIVAETITMAANQTFVPVVFSAPADAAVGGSLADIIGRPVDPAQKIEGHLIQQTSMVRGQNNIHVWDVYTHRLAAAVTEEAPFQVEIVEPKVPLVRLGNMDLKVRATRKEGFTAPIAIRMLYNPPDVGSAGSISIAEGQNEAIIPLNAGGGAELKPWKIVVLADAATPQGSIQVASQLATLEIAEPYVGFTFQAAAVEQGKETDVVIQVSHAKPFEGPAKVELLGLPNEVTTEPLELAAGQAELVFKVKTTANSPANRHKTLLCRVTVPGVEGEPIVHMLGSGELRIDVPLPPKADAPAAAPMDTPMPAADKPPEKRLTRLEQLRLDRENAKKAAAAKANGEAPPADTPPAAEQPAAPQ